MPCSKPESQVKHARVAVIGNPATGKSSLVSRIDKRHFRRPVDHFQIQIHASECDVVPADLWNEFEFVLVTFALNEGVGCARALAKEAAKSAPNRGLVFIVGTKLDLVPRDYSDLDMDHHIYSSYFAYFDRLNYVAVSSTQDIGIEELLEVIANQVQPPGLSAPPTTILDWGRIGTPDLHELDDITVRTLLQTPECMAWDAALKKYSRGMFGGVPAHKITPTLIAKVLHPSEYANMQFVRQHTTIPVPQPRYPHLSSYLVMDYVEGKMLLECWDSLSLFMKYRIACTLRGYISQLRRLQGTIPGTVAMGIVSGVLFDDQDYGPFESAATFQQFCEIAAHDGWKSRIKHPFPGQAHPPLPVLGGSEWSLVFTHADLNLTNILLSNDGVLWIIDWATSGFFPPWLETVGLRYYEDDAPASWRHLRWFMAGTNPQYEDFWDNLIIKVHRYRSLPSTYPKGHLGLTLQ